MKETVKLSTTSLSAMKTVYIHIGLEKTGTTTLQKFLTDNESVLRKKRFYYLCDDTKLYFEGIGHFPLAACFHVDSPKFISEEKFHSPAEVLRTLKFDINRCDGNVILSCEHLSSRLDKREYLESIRTSLPNQNIKIICYLRRQDEMALDAYSTMVCYGRVNPITIAEVIGCNSDYFDYKKICDLWASVFGHENVILREYKRSNFEGGDIRRDFLNL